MTSAGHLSQSDPSQRRATGALFKEVKYWNQRLDGHPEHRGKEEANPASSRKPCNYAPIYFIFNCASKGGHITRIVSKIVEFVATAKFKFVTAKITFPWK